MEKKSKSFLREGEKLRWESAPDTFPLADAGNRKSILTKWILTPVLAILFLIFFIRTNGMSRPGFVIVVIAAAAVIMILPLIEYSQLKKQRYYITDQRVLVQTWNQTVYGMELGKIDGMQVVNDAAISRCLVFGKSIFQSAAKQMRWQASHPKTEGTDGAVTGLVFYCPAHVDEALSLLRAFGSQPAGSPAE